ncbi:MAG: hypothetical protein BroJett025_10710 [Patescibacteria group bacterium]|nr:MAG: hypothetical protein BroJett025_10710 [Patescibacteria group bacterium]
MNTFLSIIIPTLNEERRLPILLRNLENQTFKNFEVIHVDGKSHDQTVTVALSFSKKIAIKTITAEKRNVCYQRNLGSKSARADWLLFVDADVQLPKKFLEQCYKKINDNTVDIFVPFYEPDIKKLRYVLLTKVANFLAFFTQNSEYPFATESVFGVRRKIFEELGGFDETVKVNEGRVFVNKAKNKGYAYTVFARPKYLNSMRRAESFGLRNLLKNNVILTAKILLGMKMNASNVKHRYEMKGGSVYKE